MSENDDLVTLIRKRGTVKSRLTTFKKRIEEVLNQMDESTFQADDSLFIEIQQRTDRVEALINEYENIQTLIDIKVPDNELEAEYKCREEFETKFYSVVATAKIILSNLNGNDERLSDIRSHVSGASQVATDYSNEFKLPQISIPKFEGSYDTWLEFRDTFESLVNSNSRISDIQKFHYLRGSLTGDAAEVIKSLDFSATNYENAWHILCERYNNSRLLVNNHVKALFELERITKESSVKLRSLTDTVSKHLRALNSLEQPTDKWDTLIIHMICTKLDNTTLRKWEECKNEKVLPSLDDLKQFLKARADLLETLDAKQADKISSKEKPRSTKSLVTASSIKRCINCNEDHQIYNCQNFQNLKPSQRIERVKKLKLCINCLKLGHFGKDCKASACKKCNAKHNTLLHFENNNSNSGNNDDNKPQEVVSLSSRLPNVHQVLLATAYVQVLDKNKSVHNIRVLLDPGSQSSFITSNLCEKLKLDTSKIDRAVEGIGNSLSNIDKMCTVEVRSQHNNFGTKITCNVIPQITKHLPNSRFNPESLELPGHLRLADPSFYTPSQIDMLIGADRCWNLTSVGQINLSSSGLVMQKTKLGWVVTGPLPFISTNRVQCNFITESDLSRDLQRFWMIEEIPSATPLSKEDKEIESHFLQNVKRDTNGRFVVSIPFKDDLKNLGESKQQAAKQFLSLEKKLCAKPKLRSRYVEFMNEYLSMNHMNKTNKYSPTSYYMPHHGVVREDKKLRVVFNASYPTDSGFSLNDLQMTGSTIQQSLFSIILRFRKHKFVMTADISKMYRQILVENDQRCLQIIIWRQNPSEPLETYELNTVTYGTTAASFLAIRCLFYLADGCSNETISRIIKNDFYVDDLITGSDSIESARIICEEVSRVLQSGCFPLRKWLSNEPSILSGMEASHLSSRAHNFDDDTDSKTLGLIWSSKSDSFMYRIPPSDMTMKVTKRSILSEISQIFDPLGLVGPCTIIAKIILQSLWQLKISWDESLPIELHTRWSEFRGSLPYLNDIQINRNVICNDPVRIELLGFSDASESAYGGCLYVRSIDQSGKIHVRLLCSKVRVAPLKPLTVPRLELCGALLLAKLFQSVVKSLELRIENCRFYTDSKIVLAWLNTEPKLLKTFVCNRVAEIQHITGAFEWLHVRTNDNPADLLSRGIKPERLKDCTMWWNGPSWAADLHDDTPIKGAAVDNSEESEFRSELRENSSQCFLVQGQKWVFPFHKFSDLTRLEIAMAQILRCIQNRKGQNIEEGNLLVGCLKLPELQNAWLYLVKTSQEQSFFEEIKSLRSNKPVDRKSKLLALNPFLDQNGCLRVGGRLQNSKQPFDKIHPLIISAQHHLSKLIFRREHLRLLHCLAQLLLSSLRDKLWIIGGRNLAKAIVHACIKCFRASPRAVTPKMGNLPESRVTPAPPFYRTGVDYAGPFLIKDRKGRGCKITKAYLCIFICFTTKCVHLELVTALTTEAFVMALRRFIFRRGRPLDIYSDNGTNFVGASRELKEFGTFLMQNENSITGSLVNEGINWHFIPSHSPHFGGLWEAGVKSSKSHLKRIAGNTPLTFEELYSLFVQIEGILNSRPLSPLTRDPDDITPLTPSHFLIGRSMVSFPDPDLRDIKENRLSSYQQVQKLQQNFWARWYKEYVAELQQRTKWRTGQRKINIGELVLIKDDRLPPLKWRLGRIQEAHPGPDGIARVVTIKTSDGPIKRSVVNICPLPIGEETPPLSDAPSSQ